MNVMERSQGTPFNEQEAEPVELTVENPLADLVLLYLAERHNSSPSSVLDQAKRSSVFTKMMNPTIAYHTVRDGRSPFFSPDSDLDVGITPTVVGRMQDPEEVLRWYRNEAVLFMSDLHQRYGHKFTRQTENLFLGDGSSLWILPQLEVLVHSYKEKYRLMVATNPQASDFRRETYSLLPKDKPIIYNLNGEGRIQETIAVPDVAAAGKQKFTLNGEAHADAILLFTSAMETMTDPVVQEMIGQMNPFQSNVVRGY